jgi:hypothetical protein
LKILPLGAKLFHADGQTARHGEDHTFRNLAHAPKIVSVAEYCSAASDIAIDALWIGKDLEGSDLGIILGTLTFGWGQGG